jgi:hypothetical protein
MRLQIRAEQMSEIQASTEENFVRRIAAHLLERYAKTVVTLPDNKSSVDELPEETLHSMVRTGIERARRLYGLDFESSIAAFCALMFEVAPNFDSHKLSQVILNDENVEPNNRVNEMLEILSENNWETIKKTYDAEAWQPKTEVIEENG